MSNELATADNALVMPSQADIMRALKLNPSQPETQALLITCNKYGLDPILKHALLIQGSLYVTRDGLMHVAHASGKFDGLEVEQLAETQTHYVARASVWRKDMSKPFTFQGRFPKSKPMAKDFGPEMAEKVAECRALRRAFDISLCSREETWEQDDMDTTAPRAVPLPVRQKASGPDVIDAEVVEEPQKPKAAPKAQAQEQHEKNLVSAQMAFANAAKKADLDVASEKDPNVPSRKKMDKVLADVLAAADMPFKADAFTIKDWQTGKEAIPLYVQKIQENHKPSDAEPLAEGEDPFEDEEGISV